VIAVDPTSPYSGGAILGDRIRMQGHAGDAGMFIRSMATRGFLGGLARATAEVALLLDAAGKQQVLIETVGVGQDEIDIVRLADCVVVMLVPGMGDDIQNMKAGLMEIGDIFVLNKSDREGADRLEQQLNAMLSLVMPREGWHPPVVRTVASENKGIDVLAEPSGGFARTLRRVGSASEKHVEHWKAAADRIAGITAVAACARRRRWRGAADAIGGRSGGKKEGPIFRRQRYFGAQWAGRNGVMITNECEGGE